MTEPTIIELDDRVFELAFEETARFAGGLVRGVYSVRLLSGPGWDQEEADRIIATVLTECVRLGLTVRRFGMGETS